MKFQLLGQKLLIEVEKKDVAKTDTGIFLTSDVKKLQDTNIGIIQQLGTECVRKVKDISGKERLFEVGDRVAFIPHQGVKFDMDGEEVILFHEDHIVALLYA